MRIHVFTFRGTKRTGPIVCRSWHEVVRMLPIYTGLVAIRPGTYGTTAIITIFFPAEGATR